MLHACLISMLNNSLRHPKISVECRDTHTFQGLARAEASRLELVCVQDNVEQKRGTFTGRSTWQ